MIASSSVRQQCTCFYPGIRILFTDRTTQHLLLFCQNFVLRTDTEIDGVNTNKDFFLSARFQTKYVLLFATIEKSSCSLNGHQFDRKTGPISLYILLPYILEDKMSFFLIISDPKVLSTNNSCQDLN